MTTIDINEINFNDIVVATFNADPFAVEDDAAEDVKKVLAQFREANVYTAEDEEEYECLAYQLGYTDILPSKVYVVGCGNDAMGFATEIF